MRACAAGELAGSCGCFDPDRPGTTAHSRMPIEWVPPRGTMPCVRARSFIEGTTRLVLLDETACATDLEGIGNTSDPAGLVRAVYGAESNAPIRHHHLVDHNAHWIQRKRKFRFPSRTPFPCGARASGLDAGRTRPQSVRRETDGRNARSRGGAHTTAQGPGRAGRSRSRRSQIRLQRRRRGQPDRRQRAVRCVSWNSAAWGRSRRTAADARQRPPSGRRMSCQGSTRSAVASRSRLSIERFLSPRSTPLMYVRSMPQRSASAS